MKYIFTCTHMRYGYEVLHGHYSDILRGRSTLTMIDFDEVEDYQLVAF